MTGTGTPKAGGLLLGFPDPLPTGLAATLDRAGHRWHAVSRASEVANAEPEDGWLGAVVAATTDASEAFALCRAMRSRDEPLRPLLLVVRPDQLADLSLREDLFDDFCVTTGPPEELTTRLAHLLSRAGRTGHPGLIVHGPLVLNLETYQAAVAGRPLDLTYMEYELLRFLAARPGKVFTRETLLSRVWGYEYYGGARTVDVHVRRLRAKLGEEHAHLIETVRSVGYRFSAADR